MLELIHLRVVELIFALIIFAIFGQRRILTLAG